MSKHWKSLPTLLVIVILYLVFTHPAVLGEYAKHLMDSLVGPFLNAVKGVFGQS